MEKYVHRRSDRHLPPVSLIVFAALLCGFALVNLFWPKRENSELENRKLAQMPVFSVKTLLNGNGRMIFPPICRIRLPCAMGGST